MRGPGRGLVPFGFNDGSILAGQASADEIAGLHRDIGARLIRFALDWRRVEPQPRSYNFSAEDAIYCAAMKRGIAPVIAIAAAPAWAAVAAGDCAECQRPPSSEHLDSLGELARIVAERYPGRRRSRPGTSRTWSFSGSHPTRPPTSMSCARSARESTAPGSRCPSSAARWRTHQAIRAPSISCADSSPACMTPAPDR